MYISIIKLYPPPGYEQDLIEVLHTIKCSALGTGACLDCSISVELGESGATCYTTQWRNRDSLDRYLRSPLFNRVLEVMELSQLPPEVVFYEISLSGGLDVVEQARAPLCAISQEKLPPATPGRHHGN